MIGGLVEHDGHRALAIHLGKAEDNEVVQIETHGLASSGLAAALDELRFMASDCRSKKPLLHVWASPGTHYSAADWMRYREAFEAEFGLTGFPCVEVTHRKFSAGGRTAEHKHFVYLRVDHSGRAVRMSHSAARMEKVSRIAEVRNGERLTPGVFNKSVIAHLRHDGLGDIADALVSAGLANTKASAATKSGERAMSERLNDFAADEVWRRVAKAWQQSDNGVSFQSALAVDGFRLAVGEKCPVVVTANGSVHPLLRALNKGLEGARIRLRKADVAERLLDIQFPSIDALPQFPKNIPGVFEATGITRSSISDDDMRIDGLVSGTPAHAAIVQTATVQTRPRSHLEAVPTQSVPSRELTPEQIRALTELDEVLGASFERTRKLRRALESRAMEEIKSERELALTQRFAAELERRNLPSLGPAKWKQHYKADLAGLPRKYGPLIKWVESKDAERRCLTLQTGGVVELSPRVAQTTSLASEAIDIMVQHALNAGWEPVVVTGGEREWRERAARAATRAGLVVQTPELAEVVEHERRQMEYEQLIKTWRLARYAALEASAPSDADRQVYDDILNEIIDKPDFEREVFAPNFPHQLAEDLETMRQYLHERQLVGWDHAPQP
jgi:hypothetical protein